MGLLLLIIFVGGSLAFATRAWATVHERDFVNDTRPPEEDEPDNVPLTVVLIVIVFVGGFLSEFLTRYTPLSFLERAGISIAFLAIANACAYKFFDVRRKANPSGQISSRPQS